VSTPARSILTKYFLRRLDPVHFETLSAGASPKGRVNPYIVELLNDGYEIDAIEARSKSWEEFTDVRFDFVITVCDKARELRLAARRLPKRPGRACLAQYEVLDGDAVLVLPGRVSDARPGRVVSGQRHGVGRADREARVGP